jgi:ketosteroid isomerase-like protein
MSKENVEVVRRALEHFTVAANWEGALDLFAPDVEWEVRPDLPDAEIYKGHTGLRRLLARFDEVVDDMWIRAEEFIPASRDAVIVPLRWGGRGRASGVEFEESRETWTFTVRSGAIAQVREFATREEALEAAGLRE